MLAAAALAVGLAAGCNLDESEHYGEAVSAVSVQTYTTQGCSTAAVIGLSKQIADEIGCINSNLLKKFSPTSRLQITSNAVLPYLHANAKADLLKVAESRTVQINSAFRTVAQQYLLRRWFELGRCGITAAAQPGNSNHESGRALDVANYSSLISAMAARGWSHSVPGDPVHFDHLGSPDSRGKDVLAFQRLWNRNHPNDTIGTDGVYGPQTESRLRSSPATGFAKGAACSNGLVGANIVMVEGPDKVAPGAAARYAITIANTTEVDWPASAVVRVAGGGASALYDPATWASPTEVGTLGSDVEAGAQGMLEIAVIAPSVTEETPVFTQLEFTDGGGALGTIDLALTVTPNGDHDASGDADDENDNPEYSGGCSTGGAAGWALVLLPALVALRRRRR